MAAQRRQARLDNPGEDEAYSAAVNAAYGAYYAASEQAQEAWQQAEQAAFSQWRSTLHASLATYASEESRAWSSYAETIATLNSQLEDTRSDLEAQFNAANLEAREAWAARETTAWNDYQERRNQMLQVVGEQSRSTSPAESPAGE